MAAVVVQDDPDAPRVDLEVADDLLVPGAASDDLANLSGLERGRAAAARDLPDDPDDDDPSV